MKKAWLILSLLAGCCSCHDSGARSIELPSLSVVHDEPIILRSVVHDDSCRQWVDSVLSGMSLEERIGQLLIYTLAPEENKPNRDLMRRVIKEYHVGGLLFSGGQMGAQATLTNEAQQQAKVPLMITFDGEWGLAMRLRGTPSYPRNQVLGHIRNDSLLYAYGREVARQCRELGVRVNFAPVADVNINPRNPVINNRSFGDNPENVARKVIAYARGLEEGGVLSVCKHFPGHGDTEVDSHEALPTLPFTRERLDSVELYPFREAIQAGVSGIMVGHLEVPALEPQRGVPASLSRHIVNDLLTDELDFRGLVFTDALEMKGVGKTGTLCLQALKAGNDLLLAPRRLKEEIEAVKNAVKSGELPQEEIDRKCRKVLTYKYALGLSQKPVIRLSGLEQRIHTTEARQLAQTLEKAAAEGKRMESAEQEMAAFKRGLSAIDTLAAEGIAQGAFPGCQVVVMKEGEVVYDKAFGTRTGNDRPVTPADVYDLASLTKTTATLLAVMKLYDQGRLNLTDRLSDFLPFLKETDKRDITVREVLMHESGLPSTLLFYRMAIDGESYDGALFKGQRDAQHTVRIGAKTWANPKFRFYPDLVIAWPVDSLSLRVSGSLWLHGSFKDSCMQKIADTPLKEKRYRYSCVGFILLQQLVEACTGMPMNRFLEQEFYRPMGLKRTCYLPLKRLAKEEIVPSSIDPFLRKDTLQGWVHDESAAFLGGVSGNAGLFSTAEEVARICQMLLDGGIYEGRRYLSAETCRLFSTTTSRRSRRGLGFDRPDRNSAKSPCAPSAPASVYGHTGFTGTCAWIDPDNRLVYVFLSNRTYPDAWNNALMKLDIRGRIQEAIYQALKQR